jgi:hypothetical protein
MKSVLFSVLVAAALAPGLSQTRPAAAFDPVGNWTYSTKDDGGAAISGTMTIAGKAGAYTGSVGSAPDRMLQITDVLTSPNGMVVIANLPDGGIAVIKVWKGADGKLQAGWGPIRTVIPATVERSK